MKSVAAACLCLVGTGASAAPVPPTLPSAYQIIQKEGRLAFTDDSSFYDFEKNGSFYSKPLGLSGRTIEGTWKMASANDFAGPLVIQGTWSLVNGFSQINDKRQMTMSIYPRSSEPSEKGGRVVFVPFFGTVSKTYRCYSVIDELVALPKPK